MDSLIDVGKIAQLGQLQQQQRRNDIYEENSLLQAEQNRIEQRKITENTDARKMKYFLDMANDPRVKANPELANTALAQSWIVAKAPGYENPELVKQMLSKGSDSMRTMLSALSGGDADQAAASMGELQVRMGAPYAEQLVQGQLNAGKLAEQAANIEAMRNVQTARFEKLHNAQSKINAGELVYSQGIRDFSTLLQGTDSKDYLKIAAAAAKISPANGVHPRSIGAGLAKNQPDVARFGGPSYEQASAIAAEQARKMADGVGQVEQTLQLVEMGEPLPPQTTKRDLIERIETGKTMIDAYTKMSSWSDDPYNLKKLNEAKAAQAVIIKKRAELETLKSSSSQDAIAIRQEALNFRQTEAGKKHLIETNTQKAGVELLQILNGQDVTDERSVNAALAKVTQPYVGSGGVDVKELSSIVNNLKGTGTKIYNYDPKQSVADAGKLANVIQSIGELGEVRKLVVDPAGSVNRSTLFASALNLPFSKGRNINVFIEKAVEIKLRAATGAAARPDEMKQYVRDFGPSIKDSDELIKYKIDALEDWMQTVSDVSDPAGALRRRKDNLLNPESVKLLNSDQYKKLRALDPQASTLDLMLFLRGRKEKS